MNINRHACKCKLRLTRWKMGDVLNCETSSPIALKPYLLSWPVLTCPVPSCPLLPWLMRQSHRDLSGRYPPERQRTPSASPVRLCVPLSPARPGFGSVNPLLFSPPSRHQARPPSCSSTLSIAEVLLHVFEGIVSDSFLLPSSPTALLSSCLEWLLPPFPPNFISFPLCACCPACCTAAVSWWCFYTLPTILSVCPFCLLCVCGLVVFSSNVCLVVKCPVAFGLEHALYLTLALFPHTHQEMNKPASLGIFLNCVSTSELKLKHAWIMYLNKRDIVCTNKVCLHISGV